MKTPQVSIIIVNYNTKNELAECLKSVYSLQSTAYSQEVIVVDNASSDNSIEVIKRFPQVQLIQNKKNLGFAKANNIGAKAAKGKFLFFLNPDTQVTKDTISKLLEFSKRNLSAIVGPKILNPDGSVQSSCYNLPTIKNAILEFWFDRKGAYEKFAPKTGQPTQVETVVGAAMLIPRKTIEKVGLFDERYFMYFEDLDWCRRAQKLGLKIFWHPGAVIYHQLGSAANKTPQLSLARLRESSKLFNGVFKYFIISAVIFLGQKFHASKSVFSAN